MAPLSAALSAALLVLAVLTALAALALRGLSTASGQPRDDDEDDSPDGPASRKWRQRLEVSEADVARIRGFPQRRSTGKASLEWLKHRKHRLTASRFNKATVAMSEEGCRGDADLSCQQLILEMLVQPERRTSPKRFGVANEARARQAYVDMKIRGRDEASRQAFSVGKMGLCVYREEPWLAASPDGLVRDGDSVGSLEIKCCQSSDQMYSVDSIEPRFFDQVQGEMAILSSVLGQEVAWCDFFVWSPDHFQCRRVAFDADYFHGKVLPKLRAFYWGRYVPIARRVPLGASEGGLERRVRELAKEQRKKRSGHLKVA